MSAHKNLSGYPWDDIYRGTGITFLLADRSTIAIREAVESAIPAEWRKKAINHNRIFAVVHCNKSRNKVLAEALSIEEALCRLVEMCLEGKVK